MISRELSPDDRAAIVQFLLTGTVNGKPRHGLLKEAECHFGTSRSTIHRIWSQVKQQLEAGEYEITSVSGKKTRVQTGPTKLDVVKLATIPYSKRGTNRSTAHHLGVSKSSISRWKSQGHIKGHTSALKPTLTEGNKLARLRFCLDCLELDGRTRKIVFNTMHNVVHIDEKWFFLTKDNRRYYLAPQELAPHRHIPNKGWIPKIMFMCAVSRPIISDNGVVLFDGKIGIFPFTEEVTAQRGSKHRPAGTKEIKGLDSVNKEVIKNMMIKEIIPAIMAKWPAWASKEIYIQQDNAKPHLNNDDPDFRAVANTNGFNITIVQQPPNSPDTNVNDLGFFNAIQSLQQQTASKNVVELMNAVQSAFERLGPHCLNNVFLSLQGCLLQTMKVKGQNNYKVPHMKKGALVRANQLPLTVEVEVQLIKDCLKHLKDMGCSASVGGIISRLGIEDFN